MYNTIIHPTWLSVVFENRNQQYGAFQLRREYERNLIGGLLLSHASMAGFFGLIWLCYAFAPKPVEKIIDNGIFTCFPVDFVPRIEEIKPPQLKKGVSKPPATVKSTAFTPLVVTETNVETIVPDQNLLSQTAISSTSSDGDLSSTGNTAEVGENGTGSASVPASEGFIVADVMPSFPDEYGSISAYLGNHIRYPEEAANNGITGKVYVQFIIDENGKMIRPEIIKGLGYGCDKEVLRILAMMPKWNPGKMNGRSVKVKMTIPVFFRMAD